MNPYESLSRQLNCYMSETAVNTGIIFWVLLQPFYFCVFIILNYFSSTPWTVDIFYILFLLTLTFPFHLHPIDIYSVT